tara:strand:- start:1 stop:210 length:210 start_codon:yes stop_codon:yes gene_type:complete
MIITNAQYLKSSTDDRDMETGNVIATISCIKCEINGVVSYVPISKLGNTDYAEILRQVQEGTLTIQDAD